MTSLTVRNNPISSIRTTTVDPLRNRKNVTMQTKFKELTISDQPIEKMLNSAEPQDVDKSNQKTDEIRIELIHEEDTEEVLAMLKEFFFKDEPMNYYLQLGTDCPDLEKYATKNIAEKCSFKALNSRGEVVGVIMNGIVNKPNPDETCHADKSDHEQFKKILALMEYVDTQFSMFDLYPDLDKFLDCKILAVNSNYRGYGIAGKLMEHTIKYMQEHKITMIHVLCSSHYSARVCEKMGFKKVYTLPFVDYVVNGERPILPAAPHNAIQILVQEIH